MRHHDLENVTIMINGIKLEGFGLDQAVSYQWPTVPEMGTDGHVPERPGDRSGTITIRLLQTNPSQALLDWLRPAAPAPAIAPEPGPRGAYLELEPDRPPAPGAAAKPRSWLELKP